MGPATRVRRVKHNQEYTIFTFFDILEIIKRENYRNYSVPMKKLLQKR